MPIAPVSEAPRKGTGMVMGYLLSGIAGGLLAAGGGLLLGHPALIVLLLYSLCGIVAMIGFGLFADGQTASD